MNGLKYKFKKCISLILPIFLLGSISPEPFFTKKVKAAEIGMVGALPGSVTLWEIFQTIWAASGVIIANEEVQTAAASNFGSSAYTLSEMQSMGFIPIGVDGSNALDWDWSGLEDELENSSSEDAKIIKGVFSQNGGSGSGGNDEDPDEDPWYKKAVNWVKSVVKNGNVKLHDALSGSGNSVTLDIGAISSMISTAYNKNVSLGVPVNNNISSTLHQGLIGYCSCYYQGNYYEEYFNLTGLKENSHYKCFYSIYSGGQRFELIIASKNCDGCTYTNTHVTNGEVTGTNGGTVNTSAGNIRSGDIRNMHYGATIAFAEGVFVEHTSNTAVTNAARTWVNTGNVDGEVIDVRSPDLITSIGNAVVPNGSPSWVPTPYIDGNQHLEIIPQPDITEFTEYITEENPEISPAGEAWIDTVSPYVGTDPTPAPTTRPQPTTKPNVTPIPAGDPGSEDNPIFTTDPDPMPDIEGGFGTTFDLMDYFPFCIPSDLVAAFKVFEVSDDYRQAPYIDWNLKVDRFGIDEHIVLDFSTFDSVAALFRILIFISFCISLVVLTKTLIWS